MGRVNDPAGDAMLAGVRVLEVGGLGPVPHAGLLLAGLGADVVRVERADEPAATWSWDATRRGRRRVRADLKDGDQLAAVRALAARADVLLEGFRPGVAERIGLGPEELRAANPRLVYGRMTGWGQDGPWAGAAGHDLNYLGLTGALHAIGADEPVPPLNLVGDYGGGSAYLVVGVLAALLRRGRTGEGCVLDAAIVDGASHLLQLVLSLHGAGSWTDRRASNLLDGGAPFYRTYRCADGGYVAVGSLEPAFYALLLDGLGLAPDDVPDRDDPSAWADLARVLGDRFAARPRAHWEQVFGGTDACVTPVLSLAEAPDHPHLAARGVLRRTDDGVLVAAAPREAGAGPTHLPPSDDVDLADAVAAWSG